MNPAPEYLARANIATEALERDKLAAYQNGRKGYGTAMSA